VWYKYLTKLRKAIGGSLVDVHLVIKQRLQELGIEQRDLATAAKVTESYISQLLTGKKAFPEPQRTDVYDKMERFLKLPRGQLSRLVDLQRQEKLKRKLREPLSPLLEAVRDLILRKCKPDNVKEIQAVFEKQPFGELERLVTQVLLDVVKTVAKEELDSEGWLQAVAQLSERSYEQLRVMVLDFLDTDIFNLTVEHCGSFLDPLIESWDIDLATFGMEVVLNHRLVPGNLKKFEFIERDSEGPFDENQGFKEFLQDTSLSGDVNEEEIEFLRRLRFKRKQPTALYYYRALQNLRDPLHFRTPFNK
jgi:transcriptional regulator with XRE-family HTH domain